MYVIVMYVFNVVVIVSSSPMIKYIIRHLSVSSAVSYHQVHTFYIPNYYIWIANVERRNFRYFVISEPHFSLLTMINICMKNFNFILSVGNKHCSNNTHKCKVHDILKKLLKLKCIFYSHPAQHNVVLKRSVSSGLHDTSTRIFVCIKTIPEATKLFRLLSSFQLHLCSTTMSSTLYIVLAVAAICGKSLANTSERYFLTEA